MNKRKYFVDQLIDWFPSLVVQSSGVYNANIENKNYMIFVTFSVCHSTIGMRYPHFTFVALCVYKVYCVEFFYVFNTRSFIRSISYLPRSTYFRH